MKLQMLFRAFMIGQNIHDRPEQAVSFQGISFEDIVTVSLPRSPQQLVAMLAILKAGGAYLPIDPQYPEERFRFLVEDSGARFILTNAEVAKRFPAIEVPRLVLEDIQEELASLPVTNPETSVHEQNLAYIIYTSGSTGIPKGVMVEHRSVVNYVQQAIHQFRLSPEDRVLQFASISFDAAAEEIYPTLAVGATLVLRTDAMIASPAVFLSEVERLKTAGNHPPGDYWWRTRHAGEGAAVVPSRWRYSAVVKHIRPHRNHHCGNGLGIDSGKRGFIGERRSAHWQTGGKCSGLPGGI